MKTRVVFLTVITVLFYTSESRGFSVKSRNEDQISAGDEGRITRISEDSNALSQGMYTENLMLVKESMGNDLHDIRKREALSKRESIERDEELVDESEGDKKDERHQRVLKKITDFLESELAEEFKGDKKDERHQKVLEIITDFLLESMKDKITNFMKPILHRIKHKPKTSGQDTSTSPPISSTLAPYPSSRCSTSERHRNMETLSLLFPDLTSNKDGEPFVFVPFTNSLIRVVEQELIRESQSEEVDEEED